MIHAVILAGGWGRRFWPKSRKRFPKQLLCLSHKRSPIRRLLDIIKSQIPKERIWVVANKEYLRALRKELPFLPKSNFLIEPEPRNTAVAVGLASIAIRTVDPQAVCVVLSSDYLIEQKAHFLKPIRAACRLAKKEDALVTIGIRPNRPAEEYGYIKIAQKHSKLKAQREKIYKVEKFVEKPSVKRATAYLRSKNYLWNSGVFVWQLNSILWAIQKYLPKLYSGLERIAKTWGSAQYKSRLAKEYSRFEDISIDYGVMEKAANLYVVAAEFSWQDLGSWSSLFPGLFAQDRDGNVICGLHKGIATCGSVIFSEKGHLIATLGLRDMIIVHTPSATLVCKKDKAQQVKKLTELLEKDKHLKKFL